MKVRGNRLMALLVDRCIALNYSMLSVMFLKISNVEQHDSSTVKAVVAHDFVQKRTMALRLSCTHRHRRIYSGSTSVLGDTGCSKLPKVLAASDVDVALVAAAKRACVVHLPPYMRAGIWLSMNVIPKNAHGKLDRMKTKALISS